MADLADSIDITTDLNAQSADAVPYHGDDIPSNRLPSVPTQLPEEKEAAPEPTLKDMLTDAFKGSKAPPATPEAAPGQERGQAPAAPAPELVQVGDRWHNKDGTFASKEQIDAFNAAKAAPEGVQPQVQLPEWASRLTPLEQQQLTSLPAETRQFIERTMENVNTRGARYQEYDLIEQMVGPRRELWAQQGMNAPSALNQLFALSDFAGKDPANFVMWFADQHRIDLDALLDARDAAQQNGAVADPAILGLQQEIAQLRNTIGGFTNVNVQQQQAQNLQIVQDFMAEKDQAGNLLYPYFTEVATDIQRHVQLIREQQPLLGQREVLKAAYEFATFSNPAIRAKLQESQVQALKDNAAAEAARARAAGVSINGGPAGDASQQPNNANRSLREELVHAYHQSTLQ